MATRSAIAIEKEDGKVEAIYCHWDGYPSGNGKTLLKKYTEREKVLKLIALGNLSSLHGEIEPPRGKKHSYDDPVSGVTVAYHRDRNEKMHSYKYDCLDAYKAGLDQIDAEYHYLFTKKNVWKMLSVHNKKPIFRKLTERMVDES